LTTNKTIYIMSSLTEQQKRELIYHKIIDNLSEINENEITRSPRMEDEKEFTAESLCGIDQRTKVLSTKQMPYMAICKLYAKGANGLTYVGSGWLIDGDKVITAGHCVYSKRSGGWKKSIIVIPGKSGMTEPHGRYEAEYVMATRSWVEESSVKYDMEQ